MNIKKHLKEKYTKLNDFNITSPFFNDKKVDTYIGYIGFNDDEPDKRLRIIFDFNIQISSDNKHIIWEYQDNIRDDMFSYIKNNLKLDIEDYESFNYYNSNDTNHNNTEIYDVITEYNITIKNL